MYGAGLCLLGLFGLAAARSAERVLEEARRLYASGNYDSTVSILRVYVKKHGKEPSMEKVVPLLAEALVRKGDYRYFTRLFDIYRKKYPRSDFMPRLRYLKGVVLARDQHYTDAVEAFSEALLAGAAPPVDSLAVAGATLVCKKTLTAEELGKLLSRSELDPRIAEVAAFYEFAKLDRRGLSEKARERAERFRERYPDSRYGSFARDVIGRARGRGRGTVKVGLLAPISGYDADLGKQVVQGVQLAVDRHNQQGHPELKLIIGDTKSNMVEAARRSHEMVHVHKVPVVIGPVLSPNAAVTAAMFMDHDVVMLTPTATDEGIAGLGKNIFQLNVTLGMLGSRIARYGVENLNIKSFAIVAPLSDYGRILSKNFKETVKALGGEIVVEEHYDEGANDFRRQLESIRARLIARRREKAAVEEGAVYTPSESQRAADSLLYADSTLTVGGLFLPGESEDVVMLAPQVYFHRIRTQLLGSTGWHTSSTILDGKRYVNDAIISTSFEIDPSKPVWQDFSSRYQQRFGRKPDRIAAPLAYDAASLVIEALKAVGGDDPGRIADQLHAVRKYHGVSGLISFDPEIGANTETAIMKIKDRTFVRIE
jgi:ABC-type branched-subunit amino acid transport system substrate-binding protein